MKVKDLVPFRKNREEELARRGEADPFYSFHSAMDRLFENFMGDFNRFPSAFTDHSRGFSMITPRIDMAEDPTSVVVTAELAGIEEKDVELTLSADALIIKGEKKMEKEEKERDYYRSERMFGSFHRSVPLPEGIDRGKVSATFKQGVLKVTLPKTASAQKETRKIEIKKE